MVLKHSKKGDSDFLRSEAMRTPLTSWMHVGPPQRNVYQSQYSWCPSQCPGLVSQAVAKLPTHGSQCHVGAIPIL